MTKPLFGPGGNSDSFTADKKRTTPDAPQWVKDFGLDAYEYEAGRGVPGSIKTFEALGENAKKAGISLSIHAPYFISLSSVEEEKRKNSSKYILDSAAALKIMGGKTIVIHAGSCAKIPRETAAVYAKDALRYAIDRLHENGLYGFDLGIALVRFFALLRIKPHAPLLVRAPVNSFEFQPCGRTPQAEYLLRLLRHRGSSYPLHLVFIVYSVDYQGI